MGDIDFREPAEDEAEAFWLPTITAFGMHPDSERIERWKPIFKTGLSVGALDAGQWVGSASALIDAIALPGGATLPAALVTMVGVLPTHRRRGALRGLMARQLDAAVDKGLPLAALLASESVIYGRFGYGPATWAAYYEIDTDAAAFYTPPAAPGRTRLVAKAEALGPLREAYDRCLRNRPGTVGRHEGFWQMILADPEEDRDGASELFVVVHDDPDGRPDGAATYRLKLDFDRHHNLADGLARVVDLFGATPEVEAALWRTVLDIDLVRHVHAGARPVDDPVRWRLVEPRRLRTTAVNDFLWVRILDVERALAARTYGAAGRLVLDVRDDFRPATTGTYVLDAGPDGATSTRADTTTEPHLALPIGALGSLLLGGVKASTLAAAGRIAASSPEVLPCADALFSSALAPFTSTDF